MTNVTSLLEGENPVTQLVGHSTAFGAIVSVFFGWLPTALALLAALLGIVWYLIQIYESRTFQHCKNNWQMKRLAKQLAALKAKETIRVAQIAALEVKRAARAEAREVIDSATAAAATIIAQEPAATAAAAMPAAPSDKPF